MTGFLRVLHPFPSALDALATALIALIAGGAPWMAASLGLGMLSIQASIGALNDVVDAERDADRKPNKPIPAGLVERGTALAIAVAAAALGLAISLAVGLLPALIALLILVIGWAYDLAAKGTAWSWLPFAVGMPLLPVYAWLGAVGSLPASFAILVPVAMVSGAALAIANAMVDVERDLAAGATSVAAALGPRRTWLVHALLQAGVLAVAGGGLVALGRPAPWIATLVPGGVGIVLGAWLARDPAPSRRERGWQLEAIGTAGLAAAWLLAVTAG